MSICAEVVADSISPEGIRLTTFQLRHHRFIHSEFMTHRVFSRNARSSRAVPTEKLLTEIEHQAAMPIEWGKNMPGMQARELLSLEDQDDAIQIWWDAARDAVKHARRMMEKGAHKQIVNRIVEPYTYIDVVVSSTSWQNFFGLRDHADAQPEIRHLAKWMLSAYKASKPRLLQPGEWHLPYVTDQERRLFDGSALRIMSTARCARVSYKAFDGKVAPFSADLELYNRLVNAQPLHASPAEHQARPDVTYRAYVEGVEQDVWEEPKRHGNFRGWVQHRKTLPNEYLAPHDDFINDRLLDLDDPLRNLPFVKDDRPALVYTRNVDLPGQ